MSTIQNDLVLTGDVVTKSCADDVKLFAAGSQSPMFPKKIFCARQIFSQNINSWEGPVKSGPPLGVKPAEFS
jgi:hypothetical protein